jgi:CHAD domain-containing protein
MGTPEKYLFDYYLTLQSDCIKSLNKVKKSFKRGDIHNFRVCVKKINAFKLFIDFIRSDFKSENESLAELYKSAGKLRTDTLLKSQLKDLKILDKRFRDDFSILQKKHREKFESRLTSLRKEVKKIFSGEKDKVNFLLNELIITEADVKKYLNSLFTKLTEFNIVKERNKSYLHALRKLMKESEYNYILICDAFYFLQDDFIIHRITNLNKILGKWHDVIELKKFIHKTNFKNSDRIIEQLNNDLIVNENLINTRLNDFLSGYKELNF